MTHDDTHDKLYATICRLFLTHKLAEKTRLIEAMHAIYALDGKVAINLTSYNRRVGYIVLKMITNHDLLWPVFTPIYVAKLNARNTEVHSL